MQPLLTSSPPLKIIHNAMVSLPSPAALNGMWNFGSLLGLCLSVQLGSGIFLAMHYEGDADLAFTSVSHICRDVNQGWLLRVLHANGASAFFMCLYAHVSRGIYFGSFLFKETWVSGVVILLLVMAAAFLGYVLPWGQMSFWGATVITNLFSAIPFLGSEIVTWLWGGFAVDRATLTRFFAFHFLVPFVVAALSGVHLLLLHQSGSGNPIGAPSNTDKVPFHPYYTLKDTLGITLFLGIFLSLNLIAPWALGDPTNFIPANPLVTPVHIQPEWYFLFAYAILRSVPNKLGGVVALAASVLVLLLLPLHPQTKFRGLAFYPASQLYFWGLLGVVALLTWIGARPVEPPYVSTGQVISVIYFSYFFLAGWVQQQTDRLTSP